MVTNYSLTIKTLNLLHNKIDEVLVRKIENFITNKSTIENTESHKKYSEPYKFKPLTKQKTNDIVIKVETNNRVNKTVQNSNSYSTNRKSNVVLDEYEEMLATNFKNNSISSNGSFDDYELIVPSEDLRFKKHTVLPFNIK